MPRNNHHHQNATTTTTTATTSGNPFSGHHPQKPNSKFLSFILQALIMTLTISLFFIFIGIGTIIFIHICIAGGALRHRRNHRRPISGNPDLPSGYSLELLKTLPKSSFKGSSFCTICLDNVVDGEICRVLPGCNHVFHLNCVDKWIVKSPVCPLCRSSVKLLDHQVKGRSFIDWDHLWSNCSN